MATITNDDEFVLACNHLIAQGQLLVQGERFIDRAARKVFDERGNGIENLIDITPDTATLESALDAATVTLTTAQTKAIARTLMLSDAKNYLSAQLQSSSPNVTNIYTAVRDYVASNATLSQMLLNEMALFNSAYGVTINTTTPTPVDRARYLICCQLVLATIA